MGFKLQIRRGLEADLPQLDNGEVGYTQDTHKFFVGTPEGNRQLTFDQTKYDDYDGRLATVEKAPNEYEWDALEGQLTYTLVGGATYNTTSKWLTVTVGGATVEPSLIQKDSETQFTLLLPSSAIEAGMKIVARWVEPYIPATAGHKNVHELGGYDPIDITKLTNYQEAIAVPLADTTQKIGWVDPIEFGCIGDGVADDTAALQSAIDYAQSNRIPLIDRGNKIYSISSPLYATDNLTADFNYSTIRKTTNTVGVGSYVSVTRGVTYTFEVDAVLIAKKAGTVYELNLKNINFNSTAPSKHQYGVYAPLLAKSTMQNFLFQWGKFDYGAYGYVWWLIPTFKNIRLDDGIATWRIANDGSGLGGSTSVIADMIIGTEQPSCFQLYGVSYSVINTPLIDNVEDSTSPAFSFAMCDGVTVNSPSVEVLRSGRFLKSEGSTLVINTPRAYQISGSVSGERYLLDIDSISKVTINNGAFEDYNSGTSAISFPLMIRANSHVIVNNTKLPTNGNGYRSLTNGSTLLENQSDTGTTFRDADGAIQKINGKKVVYSSTLPTTGTWNVGDVWIKNSNDYNGKPFEYTCVLAGTPGTWKMTKQGGVISGTITYRPSGLTTAEIGFMYVDTTVGGKPIWWNGTTWLDATGRQVWTPSKAYAVNDIVNTGLNQYKCTVAGTSGTTMPTHTTGTAVDGTVTWEFVKTIA